MTLTNISPPTDHIANACAAIDGKYTALLQQIAQTLEDSITLIDKSDGFTPAEFWARQGTNGVTLVTALGTWRNILNTYAPNLVSGRIAAAGSTLVVGKDGTVAVK